MAANRPQGMVHKLSAQTQNSRRLHTQKPPPARADGQNTSSSSGHVASIVPYRRRTSSPGNSAKNTRHHQPDHGRPRQAMQLIFERMANDCRHLISRTQALEQRRRWEKILEDGKTKLVVNLAEIQRMTPDYADELFGVLARTHGYVWIIDRIHPICGAVRVMDTIEKTLAPYRPQ